MKANKFKIYLLVIPFLVILYFPLLNENFNWIKDIKSSENRRLASKPVMNINLLDPFPQKYEKYYEDHFPLRFRLIKSFNLFHIKLLNTSPIEDVIIGKQGWLFMGKQENDAHIGKDPLTNEQLAYITNELNRRKEYLEKRACQFYLMIAPSKGTIYPEFFSDDILKLNTLSWGEQLVTHLKKNSKLHVVDLYQSLRKQKQQDLLYYKTDNHWTELGAFYGSNALLSCINKDFNTISSLSLADFKLNKSTKASGNISDMLAEKNIFADIDYKLIPKKGFRAQDAPKSNYSCPKGFPYCWDYENAREIKGSTKPKILIISDSFGGYLFPFVAEKFSKTVKIFDAWQYKLNEEIVENEKPDIVVLLMLESSIKTLLKHKSLSR